MLIERHQDYVLGPNQDSRLASVAAGASFITSLTLDSDGPFILRSRAMRVKYNDFDEEDRLQAYLGSLLARFSGPQQNYFAQVPVRQNLYGPYFGQLGLPIPVYPEVFYPRQSTIYVHLLNDGAHALTNLTFYFRGVKLFSAGSVKSYEYPADVRLLPYVYPQGTYSPTDGLTLVRSVPITGVVRNVFRVKPDADFVFRAGQAGVFGTTNVNEVFITLRDEDEKPYSNDGVAMDVLFGNSDFGNTYFPTGAGGAIGPRAGGPNSPGLLYPEIYLPKNHIMYMDVRRDDAGYTDVAAADIPISFIGQKVFAS